MELWRAFHLLFFSCARLHPPQNPNSRRQYKPQRGRMIGEKEVGISMTSSSGSRVGGRTIQHDCFDEVDAIRNPTELFRKINSGDWDGALRAVRSDPDGARTWIFRQNIDDNKLVWKYLPLHLICLQQRPPMELLLALLQVYPQAASLPTPHDGNLPLHYVCESGCDDENVFASLLASFPGSLEVNNVKGKSPLLVCHPKSRGVLMKVMRLRKSLPFADVQQPRKRDKSKKHMGTKSEHRDDRNTLYEDSRQMHRRTTKLNSARKTKDRQSYGTNSDETCEWKTARTPKTSNHHRTSKKQPQKEHKQEPVFSFFSNNDSTSGGGESDTSTSYLSSKTSELARTALNFLYPSHDGEPHQKQKEYPLQSLAARILDRSTSSHEVNTDEPKLCERILAQAEADSVAFRTEIQQLQDEKAQMKKDIALQENESMEFISKIRTTVREKFLDLKIQSIGDGSSSLNTGSDSKHHIVEAIQTLFSHMEERNTNLYSKIASLETDLSKSDVTLKTAQSRIDVLQDEKNTIARRFRELESKALILEEDKEAANREIVELKDRTNRLTVMNQTLQDQVNSTSHWNQEEKHLRSELGRVNTLLVQLNEQHAVDSETKFKALLEKNQSLKDTILANNEKYSKKVQELSERYSSLEKENKELKLSLEKKKMSSGSQSDVKVQLGRENTLLYEV